MESFAGQKSTKVKISSKFTSKDILVSEKILQEIRVEIWCSFVGKQKFSNEVSNIKKHFSGSWADPKSKIEKKTIQI